MPNPELDAKIRALFHEMTIIVDRCKKSGTIDHHGDPPMNIHLIVKGPATAAYAAAMEVFDGILDAGDVHLLAPHNRKNCAPNANTSHLIVPYEVSSLPSPTLGAVVRWFCRDLEDTIIGISTGFKVGSLLHYFILEDDRDVMDPTESDSAPGIDDEVPIMASSLLHDMNLLEGRNMDTALHAEADQSAVNVAELIDDIEGVAAILKDPAFALLRSRMFGLANHLREADTTNELAGETSEAAQRWPRIKPLNGFLSGMGKSGTLFCPPHHIADVLGFQPNIFNEDTGPNPDGKVTMQWNFTVDNIPCSIWDYKGSADYAEPEFSFGGPLLVAERLFPTAALFLPNKF